MGKLDDTILQLLIESDGSSADERGDSDTDELDLDNFDELWNHDEDELVKVTRHDQGNVARAKLRKLVKRIDRQIATGVQEMQQRDLQTLDADAEDITSGYLATARRRARRVKGVLVGAIVVHGQEDINGTDRAQNMKRARAALDKLLTLVRSKDDQLWNAITGLEPVQRQSLERRKKDKYSQVSRLTYITFARTQFRAAKHSVCFADCLTLRCLCYRSLANLRVVDVQVPLSLL
jgi:hypothetical protein